jgi:hypothetical protein
MTKAEIIRTGIEAGADFSSRLPGTFNNRFSLDEELLSADPHFGGNYGEVTLHFQHGAWRDFPWTFPDYKSGRYHRYFFFKKYLQGSAERFPGIKFGFNQGKSSLSALAPYSHPDPLSDGM